MPRFRRLPVAVTLILTASLTLLDIPAGQAAPRVGQRTSDCKNWDCSGGIICSCCFSNGCWICDAEDGKPKTEFGTDYCHWDDAARNQGITPGTRAPGGGLLDPGTGGTVKPKLQQVPTTEGATQ